MSEIKVANEGNYAQITASGAVMVDFYADWCGPCKMLEPVIDEAASVYEGKVTFARLNVDDNQSIAAANKVLGIPTLLFFKDGTVVDRTTGAIDRATLTAKLDALL
ncbi:MAG: thioredoxin [Clostridiales bacterium]|nr:thioredoxin [Clostridiales bacterium]